MPKAGKNHTLIHSFFCALGADNRAFQDISSDFVPDFVQNLIFKHTLGYGVGYFEIKTVMK